MSIYQDNDFDNREDYLLSLATENDQCIEDVRALADLLGENEDFDGLVVAVEDMG